MKKNKWVAVAGISALVIAAATALGVNIDEIRSTSSEVIQFENYSGPHAIIYRQTQSPTSDANSDGRLPRT